MKNAGLMLMVIGLLGVQVHANLDLTGGSIYADASEINTTFADGTSPWSTDAGNTKGLWWGRGGFGYNAAGELQGTGANLFEAIADDGFWRSSGPVQGLKTTVTGLVDGQPYAVYVVYGSKHAGENWNVTASFDPITTDTDGTVTSGITYGAADGTLFGVNVLAGEQIGDNGGGIFSFMGFVGYFAGTADGMLDLYIDDISDLGGANERAWYDGVYLHAIPEPTTMLLLGLGALSVLRKRD